MSRYLSQSNDQKPPKRSTTRESKKGETQQQKPKKPKSKPKNKKRSFKRVVTWGALFAAIFGLLVTAGGQYYVYSQVHNLEPLTLDELKSDASSNMYAKNGDLIWSSSENRRIYAPIDDIPKTYKDLLIATEDRDFYEHQGVSLKGIFNAGLSVIKSKFVPTEVRGGSTIEQQLIKLTKFSTDSADRTISRKVKEMYLANQLYQNYSHDQILEFYINKINLGENSYGAQTIAHTYFGKPLKDLTISQQAIIAGLGQAPSTYNLYDNPDAVKERRDIVLASGLREGVITDQQYNEAKQADVTDGLKERFWDTAESLEQTKAHNAFVTSALEQVAELGYDIEQTPMQIQTTLDVDGDNFLREKFNDDSFFPDKTIQAALTVIDPKTGDVIAQIGGRHDTEVMGYNRATKTVRSSGSAIKPIMDYAPGIEYYNWGSNQKFNGDPYTYAGTNVTVKDYGGTTHGVSTMQTALRKSYNPPAIRALEAVGEAQARANLKRFGIPIKAYYLSNALGVDVSSERLAAAFGAIGNNGEYHKPRYVASLTFSDGSTKEIKFNQRQAVRPSTAYVLTSILKGTPSAKGLLPEADLTKEGIYAGAKTGTVAYSGDNPALIGKATDSWLAAYTKSTAIAMWWGYDEPNKHGIDDVAIMPRKQALYRDLMRYFSKGKDTSDWDMPNTVRKVGGGNGLDAYYQPIDSPRPSISDAINSTATDVDTDHNYNVLDTEESGDDVTTIQTPDVPKPKKDNWREELQKEKDNYQD